MRIVYVSQYFPPEMGAPSARVHELSRAWVRLGHQVTVVTAFAHHPTGVKAPSDRGVVTRREKVDGIDVVRTYVYAAPNRGTLRRMISYASFMVSAATIGRARVKRADVVIGTSPQLLCGVAGYAIARTLGCPFVFEVRDLWPESILAVEIMKDNALLHALRAVARFLYTRSERIVTPGEGYKDGIRRLYGIDASKISVVPNGIDTSLFRPAPGDPEIRKEYGWGDRFVVLYVGTLGMAHGLDQVLDLARALLAQERIRFVFVGEGAEKDALMRRAREERLGNVQFIDQQPKSRIPRFYAACDLGLVVLRDLPLLREVLPSKIFEYLGMERAILLAVGGEARRLLEDAGAGEYVSLGDIPAAAATVLRLSQSPERLAEMGRRGRKHVLAHFDRDELAVRYLEILDEVVRK